MIIAEFRLDHPILRETLERVPDARVTWERSDVVDGEAIRVLVWVEFDDPARFEAALDADPTVGRVLRVVPVGDRYLYQLELDGSGWEASVYPLLVEEGGVVHELTASHAGWEYRVGFPAEDALARFWRFCERHGVEGDLERVYEERPRETRAPYGLTDEQHEALTVALERGYFEIPRDCSLTELGEALGVSRNAASERMRRGVRSLVANTLESDGRERRDDA